MKITSRLALLTYKAATAVIAPLGLLCLMHKKRRDPPYGRRKWELLGYTGKEFRRCVWFHAVSVGEVIAARPVIAQFVKHHPKLNVIVTTTTTTGEAEAQKIEGIIHLFAPLDSPCAVRRFFKAVKPSHLFIMETELWPNLLDEARRHRTNVVIFNARMPEKTCLKYEKHRGLVKDLIATPLSMVICQTEDDKKRFERIGVPADKIKVANSLKYDLKANEKLFKIGRAFKQCATLTRVLGAMSTHDGEEEQILETFFTLKKELPDLKLVLVPRHQSSTQKALEFLQEVGEGYVLKSAIDPKIIEALKALPQDLSSSVQSVNDAASAPAAPDLATAPAKEEFAYPLSEADKILDETYRRQKEQRVQRHRQRYAKHLVERDRNPYISPGQPLPKEQVFADEPYQACSDPFRRQESYLNEAQSASPYLQDNSGTEGQLAEDKIILDPGTPALKGRVRSYGAQDVCHEEDRLYEEHPAGPDDESVTPLTAEEVSALKDLCTGLFADAKASVLIGDTFGEMEFYLGLCDLVFMGGSFVDIGGHNPLEPACFALPVITGPYYYNFKEQYEKLIEVQGAYLAPDHKRLYTLIKNLFDDPDEMVRSGMQALDVQEQGRGATKITLEWMERSLLR